MEIMDGGDSESAMITKLGELGHEMTPAYAGADRMFGIFLVVRQSNEFRLNEFR